MFSIIKVFFNSLGKFLSFIYPYTLHRLLTSVWHYLHSGYMKEVFCEVGANFYIQSPLYLVGAKYITIGDNFNCFARLRIEAYDHHLKHSYKPKIRIGNGVAMNFNCHIACINEIIIGDNVLIASNVFITDHFHGRIDSSILNIAPNNRDLFSSGKVTVGDNVWIGENVAIMPNLSIGNNCIIGANSVVTKSFPENTIIAGVPARVIKTIS